MLKLCHVTEKCTMLDISYICCNASIFWRKTDQIDGDLNHLNIIVHYLQEAVPFVFMLDGRFAYGLID
jgi:hypothetical protein